MAVRPCYYASSQQTRSPRFAETWKGTPVMSLRVIGAGFGRTGTDSMREALNILGFGPCHHMVEVNGNDDQRRLWRALAKGAPPDWDRLFEGYASCLDWPSAYYWREISAHYPDARVILTLRSADSWWESFEKTILRASVQGTDPDSLSRVLLMAKVFDGRIEDRAHAIARFEANTREVVATVPADRLLVFELGDGWEPLCRHLGVPVPDQPYPNRNNTADFLRAVADR
jgi:hypothetical protein